MRENRVQAFLNIECKTCSNRVRFSNSTLEKRPWKIMRVDCIKQGNDDCCAERVRQHKKTLSRVSGKRKKKYHPNGCVDRKII